MASLYGVPPKAEHKFYRDYWTTFEDQLNALEESSTVYVGNLDFNTSEEKIYDLFSRCGVVEQIIMGINKFDKSPCGFCFVVYAIGSIFLILSFSTHEEAESSVYYLNSFLLDNKPIRIEMDWGFSEGRQYGRAPNGGMRRHFLNNFKGNKDYQNQRRDGNRRGGHNSNNRNRNWNDFNSQGNRRRERSDNGLDSGNAEKRRRY